MVFSMYVGFSNSCLYTVCICQLSNWYLCHAKVIHGLYPIYTSLIPNLSMRYQEIPMAYPSMVSKRYWMIPRWYLGRISYDMDIVKLFVLLMISMQNMLCSNLAKDVLHMFDDVLCGCYLLQFMFIHILLIRAVVEKSRAKHSITMQRACLAPSAALNLHSSLWEQFVVSCLLVFIEILILQIHCRAHWVISCISTCHVGIKTGTKWLVRLCFLFFESKWNDLFCCINIQ